MEQKITVREDLNVTVREDLNGWVSEDMDGEQYFSRQKPYALDSEMWDCDSAFIELEESIYSRLDLGLEWRKSLRQVINGVVQEPRPELKVDDRVLVWDRPGKKCRRHFKEWADDGRMVCFGLGRTSWSTETEGIHWSNWKLPEGDK